MAKTQITKICPVCNVSFTRVINRGGDVCSIACHNYRGTESERFFSKVLVLGPDDCWLWTAGTNSKGYGLFSGFGTNSAHRASWILHNGPIPDQKHVLHTCDTRYRKDDPTNRRCVNPRHLKLGTTQENTADKIKHGRARYALGEHSGPAKLTPSTVLQIFASAGSHSAISKRFQVCEGTVQHIKKGWSWNHVTGLPRKVRPAAGMTYPYAIG